MKTRASLWIGHRKAVIVVMSGQAGRTTVILSKAERQPGRFAGVRSTAPYETGQVQADNKLQRRFTKRLERYYDKIITAVRHADDIRIFGPGEAKVELKKRFNRDKPDTRVRAVETSGWMAEHQVAARARGPFSLPLREQAA
ncbi:MAG: hypothetical protein HZC54_23085 [Verrucomicrobia bacterium]|nr:hypothetical protein [Verrucomicrobiota bacterium]